MTFLSKDESPNAIYEDNRTGLEVSVLLCTHNPRLDYLQQSLSSLQHQTLPMNRWELLLIDNASTPPVADQIDIRWHPRGRHETVSRPGKTHAILAGIRKSTGNILVTVDDDNVLDLDYLSELVKIFETYSDMGIISGRTDGVLEHKPSSDIIPYIKFLAIRNLGDKPIHGHINGIRLWTPFGAGMGFRRDVAEFYLKLAENDPLRMGDREDCLPAVNRAQDTDMALCAGDLKLESGYFPQLRLQHLIPSERLEPNYLESLIRDSLYGATLCLLLRSLYRNRPRWWVKLKRLISSCLPSNERSKLRKRFLKAMDQGEYQAVQEFKQLKR